MSDRGRFDRFIERAKSVLKHIPDSEHLFLGLLHDEQGSPSYLWHEPGVDRVALRTKLHAILQSG